MPRLRFSADLFPASSSPSGRMRTSCVVYTESHDHQTNQCRGQYQAVEPKTEPSHLLSPNTVFHIRCGKTSPSDGNSLLGPRFHTGSADNTSFLIHNCKVFLLILSPFPQNTQKAPVSGSILADTGAFLRDKIHF